MRHGQGDPRDRRSDISRDDGRTGNHRELGHVDLEIGLRSVHEGCSDITRKAKVNASSFDGKLDATTFSDWIVAMEDYFDWIKTINVSKENCFLEANQKFLICFYFQPVHYIALLNSRASIHDLI